MQAVAALWVVWGLVGAAPQYVQDPFGDDEFRNAPLIYDVTYPTKGRGELSLLFATSTIDKYSSHLGGLLDFNYHLLDTVGVGVSAGFLHGALTNIVTSEEGIIGNKMKVCLEEANCAAADINPNVPDYKQITGIVDLIAVWSPLYGKINVVSELDANLQLYVLGGFGINGTRRIEATPIGGAVTRADYDLRGGGFGRGGFFENSKVNGTFGVGLRIFLLDWLDIRGEYRTVLFNDSFDFGEGTESYLSDYHFLHAGLGFILF